MRKEDHTTHETEAPAETHIQKANIAIMYVGTADGQGSSKPGLSGISRIKRPTMTGSPKT